MKGLQKKVLVLTLLFTILIQITMPMYVRASTDYKPANVQTLIGSQINGTNITFSVIQKESYEGILVTNYTWRERPSGGNWQEVAYGASDSYTTSMIGKKGYEYCCLTATEVYNSYRLLYELYNSYMGRNPDDGGYNSWYNKLINRTLMDQQNNLARQVSRTCSGEAAALCMSMVISNEYLGYWSYNQKDVKQLIIDSYAFLLGRAPNEEDISHWTSIYTGGADIKNNLDFYFYNAGMIDVINGIAGSQECINRMNELYGYTNGRFDTTMSNKHTIYYSESNYITIPVYQVNLNTGTGIASVTGADSYVAGQSVTINATPMTGYLWSNWNGSYNTTTKNYSFTMPNNDVTITANATPIQYTVTYNGNGATGGSTGNTTHIYNMANNLARNGYTRSYHITYEGNGGSTPSVQTSSYAFYRWRQYADLTGNSYTSGQTNVGNLSSTNGATITLYAQWTRRNHSITSYF